LKIHQASLFEHPVFREAVADLAILGVEVKPYPCPGAKPYAVVGGRSNARWWLVPLDSGRITASGLALFQPLLTSARIMKSIAITLSRLGLSGLWVRQRVYLSGESALRCHFQSTEPLTFAYFTGTDSPHRKVAVQIMDDQGRLKGFAKLTRNPQVRTLLAHEAATLKHVRTLGLQTAYVPKVLFFCEQGERTLLVTDTLKTHRTPTTTKFTAAHGAFVLELVQKTTTTHPIYAGDIAKGFRARLDRIRPQLDKTWLRRLDTAIGSLEAQPALELNAGLCHGDFTPWNTYMANGRLYVFDWEYAEDACPVGQDIIHFILNQPQTRNLPARSKIEATSASLSLPWTGIKHGTITALLIIHLLNQSFRQIERLPGDKIKGQEWDGAKDSAGIFDELLTNHAATLA
jgi:hypothetical protein